MQKNARRIQGVVTFSDAEGDSSMFAGVKFSVFRSSDKKVVYSGKTDAQGNALWSGGCKGEKIYVQLTEFVGLE